MNTDILTLYAPQIIGGLIVITVLLLGANIAQAVSAIFKKGSIESLHDELTDTQAKRAKAEAELRALSAEYGPLRTHYEYIKAERDTAMQMAADLNTAQAELDKFQAENVTIADEVRRLVMERETLYFRNAKGQIQPITPKPRKPHTLKHGMHLHHPHRVHTKDKGGD